MHKWVNPGAKSEGGKTNNKTNQNNPPQKTPHKTGKKKRLCSLKMYLTPFLELTRYMTYAKSMSQ